MDELRVRLKHTALLYHMNPHSVTLRYCSEIIKFDDERGDITFFFSLLDGQLTEKQIKERFTEKYPDNSLLADVYFDTVDQLALIENILDTSHSSLSEYEKIRFSRKFDFFNSILKLGGNKYDIQHKIINSNVVVLGCGGLGSHIIMELAALGVGNLTIVDFDSIELSNLNRQILYREENIGDKKVFTAKNNIIKFNSKININAIETRIKSVDDIKKIITNHDLVICVADKPRNTMVKWLNESCCDLKIPFINGGLDIRRAVFYSVIPGWSGCTECWKSSLSSEQRGIIDEDNSTDNDYTIPAPAISALVSVTTGVMVCEAIKILTGIQKPSLTNNLKSFSFDDLDVSITEEWSLNKNCHCCGSE